MTSADVRLPALWGPLVEHEISLQAEDVVALERAVADLEHQSLAMRLSGILGRQIGLLGRLVPVNVARIVNAGVEAAMKVALHLALRSLSGRPIRDSRRLHKALAAASGAVGGAFGLASLPVELPFSTGLMLRSIADIAREAGEDPRDPQTALACLQVFALSGPEATADVTEGGYFAARALLAKSISDAARYLSTKTIADESAPALLRLLSQIGARFGVVVSQKLAAQSLPLLGAAGGAAVNYAFMEHFQALARGHFTVRRLERTYGAAVVRREYDRLRIELVENRT